MADMERELIEHEEHITKMTAGKERIVAELNLAAQIQSSALPACFRRSRTGRNLTSTRP